MKSQRVHRNDSIRFDDTYFTEEGYLIDTPIVTSIGIFDYTNPDGSTRRELRLPEHVFDEESLATYEGKPVIVTHEAGRVTSENVADETIGTILSRGYQDGDDVRAKIILHDMDVVQKSGLRELSLGYDLVLDETPGEWNGQQYDAIQTEIVINHLALVGEARAGEQARLNIDGKPEETESNSKEILKGATTMQKPTKKKTQNSDETQHAISEFEKRRQRRLDAEDEPKPDGETPPASDAEDVPAPPPAPPAPPAEKTPDKVQLVKDRRGRRDQEGDPEDVDVAKGVIAQQDEDIDALLEVIEELKAATDIASVADEGAPPPEEDEPEKIDCEIGSGGGKEIIIKTDSIDALVRERVKLLRVADRLNIDGAEDMKLGTLKKKIIAAKFPKLKLDGKSDSYIKASLDIALDKIDSDKDTNYQRRQMAARADAGNVTGKTEAQNARERMIARQKNGGKN